MGKLLDLIHRNGGLFNPSALAVAADAGIDSVGQKLDAIVLAIKAQGTNLAQREITGTGIQAGAYKCLASEPMVADIVGGPKPGEIWVVHACAAFGEFTIAPLGVANGLNSPVSGLFLVEQGLKPETSPTATPARIDYTTRGVPLKNEFILISPADSTTSPFPFVCNLMEPRPIVVPSGFTLRFIAEQNLFDQVANSGGPGANSTVKIVAIVTVEKIGKRVNP